MTNKQQPMTVSFNSNENPNYKEDMHNLIDLLIRNDYVCEVRYEDCGIYVVVFDYNKPDWGGPQLVWIDPEKEYVEDYIEEDND